MKLIRHNKHFKLKYFNLTNHGIAWLIRLYVFITLSAFSLNVHSQQEAMFTHYMNNLLALNPAYAGSRDALTVTAMHRTMWVGFPGAPITQSLALHSPVYETKINLGLTIVNDNLGVMNERSVYVDYAFRFQFDENGQLALGLKMGGKVFSSDLTQLRLDQGNDVLFAKDLNSGLIPNFGFGIYYSQERFFLGLSSPRLIENSSLLKQNGVDKLFVKEQRQYFIIAGALYTLTDELNFKPGLFTRLTKGYTPEADFTANLIFQEKFHLGGMYRTGDAFGLLAGLNLSSNFFIGYSYDWSFANSTPKYNFGSHEIVLQYDFRSFSSRRIRSPRYF